MKNKLDYSDDIKTIKKIMEESSRFLSLSGLSGIFAGFLAIVGGSIAHFSILKNISALSLTEINALKIPLLLDALIVLILALAGSFYFSYRQARRRNQKIWTPVSRRLLLNLLIPLFTGAFFIFLLYTREQWNLIVPAMLIFYGLALINAGKFTDNEVLYLGISELLTGFIASFFTQMPILFWIIGFGFLHVGYGLIMYRKYKG